jgi:L-ascorbate metabolism protein UlaG (beta-lactamase superfamily)
MRFGWLGRNALALGAAPLVLALAFHTADDAGLLERWRDGRRGIVEHPPGAAATWRGFGFRVEAVEVLTSDATTEAGQLPPGTQVVNMTVEVTPPSPARDDTVWCRVYLVDDAGRLYRAGPIDYHDGSITGTCGGGLNDSEAASVAEYTFLLPDDATPRALWLGRYRPQRPRRPPARRRLSRGP